MNAHGFTNHEADDKSLTVAELIEVLSKFDSDTPVLIHCPTNSYIPSNEHIYEILDDKESKTIIIKP